MQPRQMDSLDTVEMVMAIEEVLDIEIPGDVRQFGSPRELVDHLDALLSNRRPNKGIKVLLTRLARDQGRPELAEGLDGPLRREQIAAIVREIFRDVD